MIIFKLKSIIYLTKIYKYNLDDKKPVKRHTERESLRPAKSSSAKIEKRHRNRCRHCPTLLA